MKPNKKIANIIEKTKNTLQKTKYKNTIAVKMPFSIKNIEKIEKMLKRKDKIQYRIFFI